MYTSFIGNRFLQIYNKDKPEKLSAQEYFENEYFPLFYDHPQYLQSPANTPLFQVIAQKKTKDQSARQKAYNDIVGKIKTYSEENTSPDMSFALGFPSADLLGTTSGQVTSIDLPFEEEDMYASWIGAGFGVGIAGGLNLLIEDEEILTVIQQGWTLYREYVNENKGIENKVETWNGIWLAHRYSENYIETSPRANFHPVTVAKDGSIKMERPTWTNMVFTLARVFPKRTLNAYVYSFGQMNRTVGFVQFALPEVSKLSELYSLIFEKNEILSNKELSQIYQSEYGFSVVCERFSLIGLRSLQPKDLKKYIPSKRETGLPKLKDDEESIINYSIYITWIVAMLNNKQLLELAEDAADKLKEFVAEEGKVRTNRTNKVVQLLESKNRKDFIANLTEITKEDSSMSEVSNELVNKVMLEIAPDNITLFVTLLRFKYLSNNI